MSEITISEDDILPPISLDNPLVRDEFPNLIKYHEKTRELKELYQTLVGEDHFYDENCSLHMNFSLSVVGIPPFVEPYNDPILFLMATIFSFGRQLERNDNETCRRTCAAGELLATEIEVKRANPGVANFLLINAVKKLLSHSKTSTVTTITLEDIVKAREPGGFLAEFSDADGWPSELLSDEDEKFRVKDTNTMTPKLAMKLLELMAMHPAESLKNEAIILISHLQLALANLDEKNPGLMCEVANYLVKECDECVDEDLLVALRDTYLEHSNSKIARRIFGKWSKIFPGTNARIRQEIKRFIRGKLICTYTIRQAFLSFPNFCWKRLCALSVYGEELLRVVDAMKTLQKEPFCGFDNESPPSINSKLYPNFAAVCRDLLIRCKGHAYLMSYSDFQSSPVHKDEVVRMIEIFRAHKKNLKDKQKLNEETASALRELQSILNAKTEF